MAHIATTTVQTTPMTTPEPLDTATQQLPTLGGLYTHTFQEINERAIAMSAAYVEGQNLADFLAMDWGQMEAMILGNVDAVPGMRTVRYDRTRFIVQINEDGPAWADVLIAADYAPDNEDVRWLLNNLAEGVSLSLARGLDEPQGIWARALNRLQIGSIDLEPIGSGWLGFPDFANIFEPRSRAAVEAGERWGQRMEGGNPPHWRDFFSELTHMVETIIGGSFDEARDGDVLDVGPERCWRCEARMATSPVGLCDECRIDLKAADL